jgi:hypothetical protein
MNLHLRSKQQTMDGSQSSEPHRGRMKQIVDFLHEQSTAMWTLKPILGLCSFLLVFFAIVSVKAKEPGSIMMTGKLIQIAAVGGETTGWAIHLDSEFKLQDKRINEIEVSGQRKQLIGLENKRVEAKGKIIFRKGVERGEWPILELSSIREIDAKQGHERTVAERNGRSILDCSTEYRLSLKESAELIPRMVYAGKPSSDRQLSDWKSFVVAV